MKVQDIMTRDVQCCGPDTNLAVAGKMMMMPGLPEKPMLESMDLTDDGEARGLF